MLSAIFIMTGHSKIGGYTVRDLQVAAAARPAIDDRSQELMQFLRSKQLSWFKLHGDLANIDGKHLVVEYLGVSAERPVHRLQFGILRARR